MAPVKFTARPSKALKNSSQLEADFSLSFHAEGTPLLVSPQLLRLRQLGQMDLARLRKDREGWIIEVGEVKSSEVGQEMMERFQKQRLFSAQNFLSGIFGFRSKLISLVKPKSEL